MHVHFRRKETSVQNFSVMQRTMLFITSLFSTSHYSYWCTGSLDHTHVTKRVGARSSSSLCLWFRRARWMPVGLQEPQQKVVGSLIQGPSESTSALNRRAGFLTWLPVPGLRTGEPCSCAADAALSGVFGSAWETTGSWLQTTHQHYGNRRRAAYIVCPQRRGTRPLGGKDDEDWSRGAKKWHRAVVCFCLWYRTPSPLLSSGVDYWDICVSFLIKNIWLRQSAF